MHTVLSTYYSNDKTKKAEVCHDADASLYFVNYYLNDKIFLGEYYPGKSVHWAEDCAENYTLGIKKFDMNYFNYGQFDEREINSAH